MTFHRKLTTTQVMEQQSFNGEQINPYILPLLDDNFEEEDIVEESGFVGVFSTNNEQIHNKNLVYVVYKLIDTDIAVMVRSKISRMPNLESFRFMIKGDYVYVVYNFYRTNEVKRLESNAYNKASSKIKIISFLKWKSEAVLLNSTTYKTERLCS